MNTIKEFLKPSLVKTILTVIIFLLSFYVLPLTQDFAVLLPLEGYAFATFVPVILIMIVIADIFFDCNYYDIAGTGRNSCDSVSQYLQIIMYFVAIVYFYLFACLIYFIFRKFKKKPVQ